MRIMAVDYGDTRTGVAVSDSLRTIAGDAWVITDTNSVSLAEKIADEAVRRDVGVVVVGYPRNMDGTLGPRAEKSEALSILLRKRGLDTRLWDERRTTVDAHRILDNAGRYGKKRKQTVDAVAATLILEGFLRSLGA